MNTAPDFEPGDRVHVSGERNNVGNIVSLDSVMSPAGRTAIVEFPHAHKTGILKRRIALCDLHHVGVPLPLDKVAAHYQNAAAKLDDAGERLRALAAILISIEAAINAGTDTSGQSIAMIKACASQAHEVGTEVAAVLKALKGLEAG